MTQPKVSFVIAVYNGEKYVEACVDSCLNQTYGNVEVCITDDGSEDRTLQIMQEFYGADERVKIDSFGQNRGKVAAFNNSQAMATGELIVIFGADDVNYADRLEKSVAYMLAERGDLLVGCAVTRAGFWLNAWDDDDITINLTSGGGSVGVLNY